MHSTMKKGKAALSILIALSIILSCFTVAFASGNDENPTTAQLQEAFQAAVATTGAEAPPAKAAKPTPQPFRRWRRSSRTKPTSAQRLP